MLELKLAKLPGAWPAVAEPIPAQYSLSPYRQGQYTSILIRYPDGKMVSIKQIIDAGDGTEGTQGK